MRLLVMFFNNFKNFNPNTVLKDRGEILGIGDPKYHLFCYYSIKNGELSLKFKNCNPVSPIYKEAIIELVDNTIITTRPKQNLDRAHTQFKLVDEMLKVYDKMLDGAMNER